MVKIGTIIEIILYVMDMDSQVRFYRDKLGLPLSFPTGLDNYHDQPWVTFEVGECILALHTGRTGNLSQDAPKFVFQVLDIDVAREQLLEIGVVLGEVRSPSPGVYVCDGKDPEGNKFSIESRIVRKE